MQAANDPINNPILHPEFNKFIERVRPAIIDDSWPTLEGAFFFEWRWTEKRHIPPFAFWMHWLGSDKLSDEQEELLRSWEAFGHIRPHIKKSDSQTPNLMLVVFDMQAQQKSKTMYHATPSVHLDSILKTGLKPGRLTGVSTTTFPESHRWIHLFDSYNHTTDKFLSHPGNSGRIPSGNYKILKIDTAGIAEILCDPFSNHGFVTEADVILPQYISEINEEEVV